MDFLRIIKAIAVSYSDGYPVNTSREQAIIMAKRTFEGLKQSISVQQRLSLNQRLQLNKLIIISKYVVQHINLQY